MRPLAEKAVAEKVEMENNSRCNDVAAAVAAALAAAVAAAVAAPGLYDYAPLNTPRGWWFSFGYWGYTAVLDRSL